MARMVVSWLPAHAYYRLWFARRLAEPAELVQQVKVNLLLLIKLSGNICIMLDYSGP